MNLNKYKDKYKDIILDVSNSSVNLKTGLLTLDIICGGLPRGKAIEIFGHEGCGKSTLCYAIISNLQKQSPKIKCAIIDAEYSISNYEYLRDIGIDTSNLLIFSTSEGETVFNIIEDLVNDEFDIIIVDSLASLLTKEEIEGDSITMIGGFSRMISRRLKKLISVMNSAKSQSVIIFTNQMRSKIQELWKGEQNYTTPGGKAIKYYTSLRLEAMREDFIKEKDRKIGSFIRIKTHKTRYFHPFSEFHVPIIYGVGYDENHDIVDILIQRSIITQSSNGWIHIKLEELSKSYRTRNELVEDMSKNSEIKIILKNKVFEITKI